MTIISDLNFRVYFCIRDYSLSPYKYIWRKITNSGHGNRSKI